MKAVTQPERRLFTVMAHNFMHDMHAGEGTDTDYTQWGEFDTALEASEWIRTRIDPRCTSARELRTLEHYWTGATNPDDRHEYSEKIVDTINYICYPCYYLSETESVLVRSTRKEL